MKIAAGVSVQIDYELSIKGGDVIESSARSGPLRYVQGQGKMLPGLESRLVGLEPGDEKRGEIPAREAFGTEDTLPLKEMPRSDFPKDAKLEPGSVFEAKSPTGEPLRLKIVSAPKTLDGIVQARLLHPLVGRDLVFRVKVLAVDDPHKPPPAPGLLELDSDELKEA